MQLGEALGKTRPGTVKVKLTGETPGVSLVAGPGTGAVRLREPAVAVSSDHHRALSAGGPFGGRHMRAQVTPTTDFLVRGLGETLPFGSG